jgi:hypothetical protein
MGFGLSSIFISMFIGTGFLVGVRRSKFTKDILPVDDGQTFLGKMGRFLFLLVVIAGVSMFWRGWWYLGDLIATKLNYEDELIDAWWSFFVGTIGMALANLTPLGKMLLDDGVGVAGG